MCSSVRLPRDSSLTLGCTSTFAATGKCGPSTQLRMRRTPDALDLMRQGKIHLVINTPRSTGGAVLDWNMMRRLAVELNIPFVTTMAGAHMEVEAIDEAMRGMPEPRLLEIGSL